MIRAFAASSALALLSGFQVTAKSDCAAKGDAEEASLLQTGKVQAHDTSEGYPSKSYKSYKSYSYGGGGDDSFCEDLGCTSVQELCIKSQKCCQKAKRCYGPKECSNKVTGKPRPWPLKCVGKQPNMKGSYTFNGHRMNTYMNKDSELKPLKDWLDNVGGTNQSTSGTADSVDLVGPPVGGSVDYVTFQNDEGYFQLTIYSPAGQTRRMCAFEPWNNQQAHCPGVARTDTKAKSQPDINVVEIVNVQEVDCDCNALSFGIITYKQLLENPKPKNSGVGNSFIDTVVATKVCDQYPATPAAAVNFWPQGQDKPTVCQ